MGGYLLCYRRGFANLLLCGGGREGEPRSKTSAEKAQRGGPWLESLEQKTEWSCGTGIDRPIHMCVSFRLLRRNKKRRC